jgi:hypothetical protein
MILTNFQNCLRIKALKRYDESMGFIQKLLLAVLPRVDAVERSGTASDY